MLLVWYIYIKFRDAAGTADKPVAGFYFAKGKKKWEGFLCEIRFFQFKQIIPNIIVVSPLLQRPAWLNGRNAEANLRSNAIGESWVLYVVYAMAVQEKLTTKQEPAVYVTYHPVLRPNGRIKSVFLNAPVLFFLWSNSCVLFDRTQHKTTNCLKQGSVTSP